MFTKMTDWNRLFAGGLVLMMVAAAVPAQALIPNDPELSQQWYLEQIGAYTAWDTTTGSDDVTVAVLDSGIDLDHPDLEGNIWQNPNEIVGDRIDNDGNGYVDDVYGWDFVEDDNTPFPDLDEANSKEAASHGTAIAGVIGAMGNNDEGAAGIAWDVNLMPVRILNNLGAGRSDNARKAIRYAVEQGADIINLSFVGFELDSQFRQVIEDANRAGVVVIAAVGNQGGGGLDINEKPIFPACFRASDQSDIVIGVAATTHERKKTTFSNYGSNCTDISAPGEGIFGLSYHDPRYEGFEEPYNGFWSGTSIAVPMIAGSAALIKSEYPGVTPKQLKEILQLSVTPVKGDGSFESGDMGAGIVHIGNAFTIAKQMVNEGTTSITREEEDGTGSSVILASADRGETPVVRVFSKKGEAVRTFLAYNDAFRGGVRTAFGDVDGDGVAEIVTAPGPGGGPHVRIFEANGELRGQFFADRTDMTDGLHIATGDVLGDQAEEIIVGGSAGNNGLLKVFSLDGRELVSFYPYGNRGEWEIRVAAGDIDRDGRDEIITAPGSGLQPRVRVFEGTGMILSEFNAYSSGFDGGVYVGSGNIDDDPADEIITGPGAGMESTVRVFNRQGVQEQEFSAYSPNFMGGVRVASGNFNGTGANIVTVAGPGGGPHVRVFDGVGRAVSGFFAGSDSLRSGMFVSGF